MIGQVVDGHEIVRSLGVGGMGEVYLARSSAGALRAFKIVRSDRPAPQAAKRFQREALALGKLKHQNIVQILEAGTLPGGALYLGMEYVAGQDLQATVDGGGPLSVADSIRVLAQLSAALAYAHGAGVVHRDLKPANVILADNDPGRAKIIDFGLAKIAADEGLTRLTEDQQLLGSPLYWAPEQSASASVGPAADVYSLGAIAYFVLTGVPLFRPRPSIGLVYAHVNEVPEALTVRCPELELPTGMEELVASCVEKAPGSRPTAEHLMFEFDRLLAAAPSTTRASRPPRLFTGSNSSDLAQALTAQIRQVVLDLAAVVERPTDAIDRVQNQLSELELDLAMLDSEVDASIDAATQHRHEAVAATVDELQRQLTDAFRDLLDLLLADRRRAPADATPLYEELDTLFDRYRSL